MGRVEFSNDNKKSTNNYEYPKLKLTQGEKARIVIGLEPPVMEYVHTLRKPEIVNGVPQMETLKRKNGEEYRAHKKQFVGNPICEGREEVLEDKGLDKERCPMCALAAENSDYTDAPKRRYAMHVMRYRTKGNTSDIQNPFSVELLVWSFTQTVFNKLVDIRNDIEGGDLRKHDLVLGPCTNANFQQFDITPSLKKAEWMVDKERQVLFAETWKENQIPDLTIAIGARKKADWIKEDVATIKEAWSEVKAYENGGAKDTSLDTDLSALLDKEPDAAKDAEGWAKDDAADAELAALASDDSTGPSSTESDDDSDLLNSLGAGLSEGGPASEADEPKKETAPAKASDDAVDNFDDLLGGME
jgi:hypothetical protein